MSDMPMMWMPMPDESWLGKAAAFIGIWTVMMAAMMLPSLVPMLWRYRRAVASADRMHLAWLTAVVGVGYLFVWTVLGAAVFPLGAAISALSMGPWVPVRAVPIAGGAVILIAGLLQLTTWKARRLARCSDVPGCVHTLSADSRSAWRHGLRLGFHCVYCCAELMAVLLVLGVMDLRVMVAVTAAVTAERLAPAGMHVARGVGALLVVAGVLLIR